MKAVIFADIILDPRNIVIYYSPLIKAVISLPHLPLPPLISPSETLSSSISPSNHLQYHFILLLNIPSPPFAPFLILSFCFAVIFPLYLSISSLLSSQFPYFFLVFLHVLILTFFCLSVLGLHTTSHPHPHLV